MPDTFEITGRMTAYETCAVENIDMDDVLLFELILKHFGGKRGKWGTYDFGKVKITIERLEEDEL